MQYLLICAASYLLGSIPFSYLIPKFFGRIDIREHGSGNTGTTNVLRTLGFKVAVLAFIGDFLKGVLPVFIALRYVTPEAALVAGGSAVLGHCYSVWLKFKGGKGIATSAGVLLFLVPKVFLALLILQFTVILTTRYMSLASILSALTLPLWVWGFHYPKSYILFSVLLGAFATYKHRANIKRLLKGNENRLSFKKHK